MKSVSIAVRVLAAEPGMQGIVRILDGVRNLLIGLLVGLAVAALTYAGVSARKFAVSRERAEALLRKRQSQLLSQSLRQSIGQSIGQLRKDHPKDSEEAGD